MLRATRKRLRWLVRTPLFWIITLWGNGWIIMGAALFQHLEAGHNPAVHEFLDSLTWAVGMVTTVGGGHLNPVTFGGKILSIVLMMGGAVFLWSYMAFFVGALVDPEIRFLEREVSELHHDMDDSEKLLLKLKSITEEIEGHLQKRDMGARKT